MHHALGGAAATAAEAVEDLGIGARAVVRRHHALLVRKLAEVGACQDVLRRDVWPRIRMAELGELHRHARAQLSPIENPERENPGETLNKAASIEKDHGKALRVLFQYDNGLGKWVGNASRPPPTSGPPLPQK